MQVETRAQVLRAIEDLGYTPNALAQQFKSGRNRTIGLIVPSVANPFWGALAHKVERAATALGYKVLFCNAERDPQLEARYAETLLSLRRARGDLQLLAAVLRPHRPSDQSAAWWSPPSTARATGRRRWWPAASASTTSSAPGWPASTWSASATAASASCRGP